MPFASRHISLARERAFTLIELLVVILIIGILIAVAAPSFLGQQDKAKVSGLKQQEAVAYKAAKAAAVGNVTQGNFDTGATLVNDITGSEPELVGLVSTAADPGSNNPGVIGIGATSTGGFVAVGYTTNGTKVSYNAPNNGAVNVTSTPASSGPALNYDATIAADNPYSWWKLGESSGNFANSGGTDSLALSAGGGETSNYNQAGIPGSADGSVLMSGTGYLRTTAAETASLTGSFTVEGWFKGTGSTTGDYGVFSSRPGHDGTFDMQTNGTSGGELFSDYGNGSSFYGNHNSAFTYTDGHWNYLTQTVSYNSGSGVSTWTMYANGQQIGTGSFSGQVVLFNAGSLNEVDLGENEPGYMTQWAVYNSALTGAQVANHFTAGCPSGTLGSPCS